MCIIVDANVVSEVLVPRNAGEHDAFVALRKDILSGKALLVYGGKLAREYALVRAIAPLLVELRRGGAARVVAADAVDTSEAFLRNARSCQSDDEHVIALAQLSGARLLCSRDNLLRTDFKNPMLVGRPRGKVWNEASHKALVRVSCEVCR